MAPAEVEVEWQATDALEAEQSRSWRHSKVELEEAWSERQSRLEKVSGSYESIEYTPPNNEVYRASLRPPYLRELAFRELVFALVGIVVGLLGFVMRTGIDSIAASRLEMLFEPGNCTNAEPGECVSELSASCTGAELRRGDGPTFGIYAGFSCGIVLVSAMLVVFVAPAAAASGIPEVIAFLNGTFQPRLFNLRAFCIKFAGCLLAVGAGMPVGPEAPMIHLGAMVGRGTCMMKSATFGVMLKKTFGVSAGPFRQFRNRRDTRDFVTAGTAAGVAAAFGAPVGGVLFAMEEIATAWSPALTWRVFLTAMAADAVTMVMLSAYTEGFERTSTPFGVITRAAIEFETKESIEVNAAILLPALVIGLVAGTLAACFTRANLWLLRLRHRHLAPRRALRLAEPMLLMLLYALLVVYVCAAFGCTPLERADRTIRRQLVALHCEAGSYNELATLLYNPANTAVEVLWSRHTPGYAGRHTVDAPALLLLLLLYTPMACWAAGTAVPSGLVIPVLLIGAAAGRLCGLGTVAMFPSIVAGDAEADYGLNWVDPGAFAMVGSAAMFGGVSRLTLTVAVILVEITNDTRFLLPLMLAIQVAKATADQLQPHSLFHALMHQKGLAFLGPEPIHGHDATLDKLMIHELVDRVRPRELLRLGEPTLGELAAQLQATAAPRAPPRGAGDAPAPADARSHHTAADLAVVDAQGRFEGTVTREQLYTAMRAAATGRPAPSQQQLVEVAMSRHWSREGGAALLAQCAAPPCAARRLNLQPYVNTSDVTVRGTTSVLRAYHLFRQLGSRHLVVTDVGNRVVGVLTRRDFEHDVLHALVHAHLRAHAQADAAGARDAGPRGERQPASEVQAPDEVSVA